MARLEHIYRAERALWREGERQRETERERERENDRKRVCEGERESNCLNPFITVLKNIQKRYIFHNLQNDKRKEIKTRERESAREAD